MGLLRFIWKAISGPLLILLILWSHVAYQIFFGTPDPVSVQDFPKDLSKEKRESIIASRKGFIKDAIVAWSGKYSDDFVKKHVSNKIVFEDPTVKVEPAEFKLVAAHWANLFESGDVFIHGEHHGKHEIVMDWTLQLKTKIYFMKNFKLDLRSTFYLEPAPTAGGKEKVVKIVEEFYGNKLLSEKTTFPLLGQIHSKLRRFQGYLIFSFLNTFFPKV